MLAIGFDIGGTKTAIGIVDDEGNILEQGSIVNNDYETAEDLFMGMVDLARKLSVSYEDEVAVVGVATAGPMEPYGVSVGPLNLPQWVGGFHLKRRLEEEFPKQSVFIDNDCKGLVLAESWKGGAKGKHNVMAMVVSTGVGGGIIIDGNLLHGRRGNSGHIGHMNVVPDGQDCACGAKGCLEAEIAGPSIMRKYGVRPEDATPEIIADCGKLLGRAIASCACLLDLNLVLVGGSVALGWGDPFFEAAQKEIDAQAKLGFAVSTKVKPVKLGAAGGIIGGARVGFLGLFSLSGR